MHSLCLFKRALLMVAFALLPAWQCAGAERVPLAELLVAETTDAGLSVTVPTGGCTQKSDFEIKASTVSNGGASVEIRRLRKDTCKGNFPEGLKLVFTWDDLKLPANTKLGVKNLINAPFRRGQITPRPSTVRHVRGVSESRSAQSAQVQKGAKGPHDRHMQKQATRRSHPRLQHARMHKASWLCQQHHHGRPCRMKAHRPRRPSCW